MCLCELTDCVCIVRIMLERIDLSLIRAKWVSDNICTREIGQIVSTSCQV